MKTIKLSFWVEVEDHVTTRDVMESFPSENVPKMCPLFEKSMHHSLRVQSVDSDDFYNTASEESKKCFQSMSKPLENTNSEKFELSN